MSGSTRVKYERIIETRELAVRFVIDGGRVWVPRSVCRGQRDFKFDITDEPGEVRLARWWSDAHSPQLRMGATRTALRDAGFEVSIPLLEELGNLLLHEVTEWADMANTADDDCPFTPSWLQEFAICQTSEGDEA